MSNVEQNSTEAPKVLNPEDLIKKPIDIIPDEDKELVTKLLGEGVDLHMTIIGDKFFFFRSITRLEWANILADQEKKVAGGTVTNSAISLQMENDIVIRCSIKPRITALNIQTISAGVIDSLYTSIMAASGFQQATPPIKF